MSSMEYNLINQMERELSFILKEEYSFYQSLYIMLDKQRDKLKYDRDDNLVDIFTEIRRCRERIDQSEEKIANLKERNQRAFKMASQLPEVKKLVNSIATLIKKNITLVNETEEYIRSRYDRIKVELGELKNSTKIMQYIGKGETEPQFIDGHE